MPSHAASTVARGRSKGSLTVAGAVPALLRKQRTGFPFHPSALSLGTPGTGATVAAKPAQDK